MRGLIAALLVWALALPASAQDAGGDQPVLQLTFEQTEAIPGQPLSLRLTVLVPTFMPSPPVWPSLEAPNLLVRLPEGSTGPTSQRIGGETWAGVTRHYRISPMVPGDFTIPPQDVLVTYADPATSQPLRTTLRTDTIAFSGVLPVGAEGLDPFLAADEVTLEQTISGEPASMKPGDSVTRTLTASIRGTSPMFLPALVPPAEIDGVAIYPDDPVLEERDDRGVVSGSRTESQTLLAEGGGAGSVPTVSLDWFNLQTGEIETATVEGFEVSVDGPAAVAGEPRDWRVIALAGLVVAILAGMVAWLLRAILPVVRRWMQDRRNAWLQSEGYAFGELLGAASRRDLSEVYSTLDLWAKRVPRGSDPRNDMAVRSALARVGAARYGQSAADEGNDAWRDLRVSLEAARRSALQVVSQGKVLPPLNP